LNFDPARHLAAALGFAGMALAVGLLAGGYPAFFLSSLSPLRVIKAGPGAKAAGRRFRNGLVVFQFSISMMLLIGTLTVFRQIRFMKSKDLGFDPERILVIPEVQDLMERMSFESVRSEMLETPGVTAVAGSALVPTRGIQHAVFYPEGSTFEQPQKFTRLDIEPGYIPAMKIDLAEGRNFSLDFPTDPAESMLINESLARALGWTRPLGKKFYFRSQSGAGESVTIRRVIGVVKDFHFASLHRRIDPLVILDRPERIRFLSLRISASDVPAAIESLREKWKALNPRRPFDYFFLETAFARLYGAEERMGGLILGFSLLAVMIGCLGLFGLSAHTAERRTKEIGIRRVLGASSSGIFRMMSIDFLRLVLIAALPAWPAAYFGLSRWLNDFPYRVEVGWLVPVCAGFFALAVALLTVGFQAARAARNDPVSALRYE
jgi:putative ABC transport system permease protein